MSLVDCILVFLMYLQNLTGGPNGGQYVTDVTNASRTMLMNIHELKWDDQLCRLDLLVNLFVSVLGTAQIVLLESNM